MFVENVNTHAHGDVHLVVLAHLRRRWSLSSAGFGNFSEVFFTVFVHRTLLSEASDAGPASGVLCRKSPAAEFAPAHPVAREG
jgi:hypothetical protein